MIIPDQKTVYHVISRTVLNGYPLGDHEKDKLRKYRRYVYEAAALNGQGENHAY
jgi:hypothetical protein